MQFQNSMSILTRTSDNPTPEQKRASVTALHDLDTPSPKPSVVAPDAGADGGTGADLSQAGLGEGRLDSELGKLMDAGLSKLNGAAGVEPSPSHP